jgi:molybdate transport system substrate-binding protein
VMHHLMEGNAREFGFGGITDILLYRERGLWLVGPLPAEIQNYANYSAAVISAAPDPDGAKAFMAYLASPEGRALFLANGIAE